MFSTHHKKTPQEKTKTKLDDCDKCVVWRVTHEFHVTHGKKSKLKGVQKVLKDQIKYNGSLSSPRQVIRKLRFRWKMHKIIEIL